MGKRINFIVPSTTFGSYLVVARNARQWIDSYYPSVVSTRYMYGSLNVRVDCLDSSLREYRIGDIYWCDTCADPEIVSSKFIRKPKDVVVTSNYDYKLSLNVGVKPKDIVGRLVSTTVYSCFNDSTNREYDVIFIGFDGVRKGFRDALYIVKRLGLKYLFVCPYSECNVRFGSLTEREKVKLFSKAKMLLWLSRREGYGIPPLESMAVGTLVLYNDAMAHNEFTYGIKIKYKKELRVRMSYGVTTFRYVDIDDAIRKVEEVLRMSKDEYQNIIHEARERFEKIHSENVDKLNSLIYEWCGK